MQVLLAHALEFLHDLLGRGGGGQGDDDDGDAGHEEGGQQLVDAPGAAHGGQQVLPDEDHRAAGDHAGDGTLRRGPLPEQGEEDQRAEGRAEAGPGELLGFQASRIPTTAMPMTVPRAASMEFLGLSFLPKKSCIRS